MKLRDITLRYLKGQKKHTIMTVLAITVSVAFMTVLLSGISVYRTAALNICRETGGTYHIIFNGLDKEQLVNIRSMDIFDQTQIYGISAYSSSVDVDMVRLAEDNAKVEYLLVNGLPVDDTFLRIDPENCSLLPPAMRSVSSGRLPEKDGEIVISSANAEQWGYPEIGSTVKAELYVCGAKTDAPVPDNIPYILGESFDILEVKEPEFTVVGYSDETNIVHYNETRLKSYSYLTDNLLARFSDSAYSYYWDMDGSFKEAGYEIDDFDYGLNQELLDLEGSGVDAKFSQALFFAVAYLIILFFMFFIRMIIDNSFELSSKERIKQFGLLKAVGASKRQVFSMIMWEAFFLALPGVILGTAAGIGCAAVIFSVVKKLPYLHNVSLSYDLAAMLEFDIKPYVYISAVIIGFLWVFISAISTGMRSIKASPVEAVRAAARKEKIRPSRFPSGIEKGRGFIGAYSALSVKRNKKRYIITLVSMVMSIILFTVFSYAIEIASGNLDYEYNVKRTPYDYTVNLAVTDPQTVIQRAEAMRASGYFTDVQYDTYISLFISADSIGIDPRSELGGRTVYTDVHPINRETFEKNISSDISYDELLESGGIMFCSDMYSESGKMLYSPFGDTPDAFPASPFITYKVMLLDEEEFVCKGTYSTENRVYRSVNDRVAAVTAEENYSAFLEKWGADSGVSAVALPDGTEFTVYSRTVSANAAEGMEEQAKNYMRTHFYDSYSDNTSDMNLSYALLSMIKTAGYFIIAIISIMAVINVANIISSNILGRKSELAMLRACGMSDKQLYKMDIAESFFYAAMSGLVSLIVTELTIFVIQIPFNVHWHDLYLDDLSFEFSYIAPVKYLIIASAAAFAAAAVSSVIPIRKIISSPIVESIESSE